MSSVVQHLPAQNRYVFTKDGVEVGLTDYQLVDRDIHITHTEIDPSMRGAGLASEMVQGVLDAIRTETDYRVVAECPYVVTWLSRHPEYQELEQRV
ncbi:GNAT family N-acetyltransferase [Lacisediminihabitans sp. FW035]